MQTEFIYDCTPRFVRPCVLEASRFTGKERDAESGNDYFDARYYSSGTGRFMSPDWAAKEDPVPYATFDDPQSLNLYSYVKNNPLSHVDADGHCCDVKDIFVAVVTGVGTFAGAQLGSAAGGVGGTFVEPGGGTAVGFVGGGLLGGVTGGTIANKLANAIVNVVSSSNSSGGDPHAPGDVPNGQTVVRGGQGAPPSSGTYSGAQGATEEEAGKGVPHGTVSTTTGGEIRAAGGDVRPAPEPAYAGGPINGQHVNVTGGQSAFGPPHPNPAAKPDRVPSAPKPPKPTGSSQ